MAIDTSDVLFLSVDVDELEDLANENNINAMPTFICYKNGARIDELKGADINSIQAMIQRHK